MVEAGTGLDVLVNNAGVSGTRALPADTTPADFLPVFGVNLLGPVRVTNTFLPLLQESEGRGWSWCRAGWARSGSRWTGPGWSPPSGGASTPRRRRRSTASPATQTLAEGVEPIVEACVGEELSGWFIGRSGLLPW